MLLTVVLLRARRTSDAHRRTAVTSAAALAVLLHGTCCGRARRGARLCRVGGRRNWSGRRGDRLGRRSRGGRLRRGR